MAKKKTEEKVFINGGNLADGSRFEIGDKVPSDLSEAELKALKKLNCIGDEGE